MTPHPAAFNAKLIRAIADLLTDLIDPTAFAPPDGRGALALLDPFVGSGRVAELKTYLPNLTFYGTEIENPWAADARSAGIGVACADALSLPFPDHSIDLVVTSPTFGCRMADHHDARDGSPRHTYRHTLGRPLHPRNSGAMQWGPEYRAFHRAAWQEVHRVMRSDPAQDAFLVLDIKDHIRKGQRQHVTLWHLATICSLGFDLICTENVLSPGQRHGAHRDLRMKYHTLAVFKKLDI